MPRRACPSDLTDAQWAAVAPMIPDATPGGRPRKADKREIMDAILYILRAGCAWRLSPHVSRPGGPSAAACAVGGGKVRGLVSTTGWRWPTAREKAATPRLQPPSSTARPSGRRIKRGIPRLRRRKADQRPQAAYASTAAAGRLLSIEVHAADVQDRDGAKGVRKRSRRRFPFVEKVYADGGYAGRLVKWAQDKTHVALEIVKRPRGIKGFVVIRRRWVVERAFAWIMKRRRLVRHYEQLTDVAETLIIAAIATPVRRAP